MKMNKLMLLTLTGCIEITPYVKNDTAPSLKEVVLTWDSPRLGGVGSGGGMSSPYPNARKKVYVNNPFKVVLSVYVDCGFEFDVKVPPQSSSPIYLDADNSWPWKQTCFIRSWKAN